MATKKYKSQVSMFIIIAIVIVAILLMFLIYNRNINPDLNKDQNYNFVKDCLRETSEQGLYYIGGSGGYYYIPEKSTDYGIPYYFYNNTSLVPSKDKLENELSRFIEEMGVGCGILDNSVNKEIGRGNISVSALIYDDKVSLDIRYPISIEKQNRVYNYDKFDIEIPVRLGVLYKASDEYIKLQLENPSGICINCINDLANKYDIKFVTYDFDNETVIFNLLDDSYKINNQSYFTYSFAAKYNYSESVGI